MKNKSFKDRIPDNYLQALKKVQLLFFYQTVYDPRTESLVSLEPFPTDQVDNDLDFLGPHMPLDKLLDFTNGYLCKKTLEKRETYGHIMDFRVLLADYQNNNINERTFVCLDKSFFKGGF